MIARNILPCFDLEERKKLASTEYEILITQTQMRSQEMSTNEQKYLEHLESVSE